MDIVIDKDNRYSHYNHSATFVQIPTTYYGTLKITPIYHCQICEEFSGLFSYCLEHRKIGKSAIICNVCYCMIIEDAKFICEECEDSFRVWLLNQISVNTKKSKYLFIGFVTLDGIKTYYSIPDIESMNIDLEFIRKEWNINKVISTFCDYGIDMKSKIQIINKKAKSVKSNVLFIEK